MRSWPTSHVDGQRSRLQDVRKLRDAARRQQQTARWRKNLTSADVRNGRCPLSQVSSLMDGPLSRQDRTEHRRHGSGSDQPVRVRGIGDTLSVQGSPWSRHGRKTDESGHYDTRGKASRWTERKYYGSWAAKHSQNSEDQSSLAVVCLRVEVCRC